MVGSFSRTHCRDFLFSDFSVKYDFAPKVSHQGQVCNVYSKKQTKRVFLFYCIEIYKKRNHTFLGKYVNLIFTDLSRVVNFANFSVS